MRILVVEDEPKVASFIRRALEEESYAVDVCADGAGGLDWAQMVNYDLIVLDLMLPGLPGVEVLERIKGNDDYKNLAVMMLTTTDDPREVELCYKLGCNVYVTKPVDFKEFSEVLKRLGMFVQIVSV